MSFRPRLVALDVDGTIVDDENVVSPAVRDAIHAVRDAGIEVVISTGRGIPGVLNAAENAGLDAGYAVSSNGAITLTYSPVQILDAITFDASEAVHRILEHVPQALVAVEDVGHGFRVSAPFPEGEITGRMVVESVEELVSEPVSRVVIRAPESDRKEFADLVRGLGLEGTNYFIGYTSWVDLAPEGVSKASGLELLCERLDVDRSEVLAVGDGHNDVEMLLWAGRGVAMGQATDDVKVVANAVTGSVTDDGLAQELRRYV